MASGTVFTIVVVVQLVVYTCGDVDGHEEPSCGNDAGPGGAEQQQQAGAQHHRHDDKQREPARHTWHACPPTPEADSGEAAAQMMGSTPFVLRRLLLRQLPPDGAGHGWPSSCGSRSGSGAGAGSGSGAGAGAGHATGRYSAGNGCSGAQCSEGTAGSSKEAEEGMAETADTAGGPGGQGVGGVLQREYDHSHRRRLSAIADAYIHAARGADTIMIEPQPDALGSGNYPPVCAL